MKSFGFAVFLLTAAAPALAFAGPFDGTWTLDLASSKFTGDTISYAKTVTGYRFSNGATVNFTFALDGKDYPTIPSRTTAWTKAADGGWDSVTKANGNVVSKAHRAVSADGKILTVAFTVYRPDGTQAHETDVYGRVTGSIGLVGTWRNTKAQVPGQSMIIATRSGGRFEITVPEMQETTSGKTDGAPAAVTGPTIPPGALAAYKADGRRKWTYAVMLNDLTYERGTMVVSADGKTLTQTSWVPRKEAEAAVAVYVKR
jgi:hypothetical protein